MEIEEFRELGRGDIVRHRRTGESYVIDSVTGSGKCSSYRAVRSVGVTNREEWERVPSVREAFLAAELRAMKAMPSAPPVPRGWDEVWSTFDEGLVSDAQPMSTVLDIIGVSCIAHVTNAEEAIVSVANSPSIDIGTAYMDEARAAVDDLIENGVVVDEEATLASTREKHLAAMVELARDDTPPNPLKRQLSGGPFDGDLILLTTTDQQAVVFDHPTLPMTKVTYLRSANNPKYFVYQP